MNHIGGGLSSSKVSTSTVTETTEIPWYVIFWTLVCIVALLLMGFWLHYHYLRHHAQCVTHCPQCVAAEAMTTPVKKS
jgi:hypothetical protein